MRSRKNVQIATGAGVAAVLVAGVVSMRPGGPFVDGADTADAADVELDLPTATVEQRDLVLDYEAVGVLAPTATITVSATLPGTVVQSAEPGDSASPGSLLTVVDDQPVVVLDGELPMWRDLADGTEGPDVEQLERALVDAGFDPDDEITVDEEYTSATARMVEDWQESIGAPETGRVALGSVVFVAEPMRVESALDPGTVVAPGEAVVTLASESRVAIADVPVADAIDLAVDDAVEVRLPDRTVIDGVATSIVTGGDPSTRRVEIELDAGDLAVANLGAVEVDLSWSEIVAADVATLPAGAFRRLDSGVYVVDVVDGDGGLDTIVVEPGRQVGSRVEVAGVPLDAEVIAP